MSIRVMSQVWDCDLPATDKLVLLALADCANDEGKAWPGMKTLCRKTGRGDRSIQAAIKRLKEQGHLTRKHIVGKGCSYIVHPRISCAPAETAAPQNLRQPPQELRETPAESAGKPSYNRKEPSVYVRLMEKWNGMARPLKLRTIDKMTPARKQAINARLREHTIEEIEAGMDAVRLDDHWMGKTAAKWIARFDSFMRSEHCAKFVELAKEGGSKAMPAAQIIKNLEASAALHLKAGREMEAAECRRKAEQLKDAA